MSRVRHELALNWDRTLTATERTVRVTRVFAIPVAPALSESTLVDELPPHVFPRTASGRMSTGLATRTPTCRVMRSRTELGRTKVERGTHAAGTLSTKCCDSSGLEVELAGLEADLLGSYIGRWVGHGTERVCLPEISAPATWGAEALEVVEWFS